MTLNKEQLLALGDQELDTQIVELPGGLGEVKIKALTRQQTLRVTDGKNTQTREAMMVSLGMVEPRLTIPEVQEWFKKIPAGLVQPLTLAIADLSGMEDDADRSQSDEF